MTVSDLRVGFFIFGPQIVDYGEVLFRSFHMENGEVLLVLFVS